MLKTLFGSLFVVLLAVVAAPAEQLKVDDIAITTAIEQQEPVDRLDSFPADFGKLFCFTRVVGANEETLVTHVWYYRDHEMARVTLPVKSSNWRTYSSKRFLPQWIGDWRVVILDEAEQEIARIRFQLTEDGS